MKTSDVAIVVYKQINLTTSFCMEKITDDNKLLKVSFKKDDLYAYLRLLDHSALIRQY